MIDHDHEHVDVPSAVVTQYRGRFEARLLNYAAQEEPEWAACASEVSEKITGNIEWVVNSLFNKMVAGMKRRNGVIDLPKSYYRVQKLCPRW